MAQINSPSLIFSLLKNAKKKYQKVKPDPGEEPETRHKKIVEDINILKRYAKKEEAGADLGGAFEAKINVLVKRLKTHYQKLKKDKDDDPNKAQLPKYLKTLGQLTLAIKKMEYRSLEDTDDEGADPDSLPDQDLSEMDRADDELEGD